MFNCSFRSHRNPLAKVLRAVSCVCGVYVFLLGSYWQKGSGACEMLMEKGVSLRRSLAKTFVRRRAFWQHLTPHNTAMPSYVVILS